MKVYVATPTVDYPKDKAILYLPDVFGVQLPNHQVRLDPIILATLASCHTPHFPALPIYAVMPKHTDTHIS